MRKYVFLTSFFVGFLFLNYQTAFSQGCLGADGVSGFGGGVTRFQNGVVCTNLDVPGPPLNGGILQVQVTNVFPGDLIEYRILWNDGSPFTPWTAVPFIGPTTCQVNSVPHFFPTTNTNCEYTPFTFIRVTPGGIGAPVICAAGTFGIAPVYFRWNREGAANSPSSAFAVTSIASPGVVAGLTNVEVCAGVATTVTFQDLTNLNCNTFPGDVSIAGNRNNTRRWRQYEYGGAGANNNIVGGVTVGGTPVAAGAGLFGNLMTYDGGAFPALIGGPPGVPGGLDAPNTAAAFGVPVSTPTVQTLAIVVPATAVVGNTFIVTTHYWNSCNRADLGNASVPYNLTRITVVGQPAAPAEVAVAPVCNGTIRSAMPTFGISGTPGGATVRWYANNTAAVPAVPGTVGALIATTVASGGGTSSIPFSTGFPGAAGTVMPANNYIVWATYLGASGTIICESLPRAVTRSVRENLDISAQTITPVINVNLCPGSAGHTYTLSMPAAPNAQPVGGNTEYSWSVPAGWTITAGQLSNQITVSVGVGAVAGNIGVVWRYTSAPVCTSGTLNLAVAPLVVPTAGAPAGANTICEDATTTFTSAVTGSGLLMRWQVDADGAGPGTFVNVPSPGPGDPYTGETTNALTINTSGTGTTLNGSIYQLVITGTCGNATSPTRTLTVQPKAAITVQPISAPNICVNGTKVFTVTAIGQAPLTFQWEVDADGAGPGVFVNVPSVLGDPYTGETTASVTINTTGTGTTLNGARYRVNVNSTTCPTTVTSNQVILTLQGPTTAITNPSPASNCVGSNLNLLGTESFLNGNGVSSVWTGTYDETGAPPLIVLTNPQLDLILTDGVGGSRRTALNPIFNSSGLGVNKQGAYVLTLTTTDDNGCTNFATITINAGQVSAGILYGPTPGTATNNNLNATVCSATDLFLNGAPTGGSGIYTTHTWTVVTPPATPIGTVLTAGSTTATPTFNFTNTTAVPAVFVLRYFVQDNGGCNFITGVGTDITINVNPQPVVANQPIAALCSRTAVGANFNASTSVAAATYNVTVLALNGLTVSAGGAAVANGLLNTALADDAFLNTTAAQVNVVYTVVPVSAASCAGTPFTVTVPVDPQPVVANQTPAAICSRSAVGVNFSASTGVAAATYNVTVLTLNGLTVAAGGAAVANGLPATALADDAFNNTTGAPVNVVYTVVPVSAVPCQGASFTVTVTVNPEPVVANQPIAALCSRTPVGANFNASTSVAAATYNVTVLALNGLTVSAGGAAVANGLANTALADDAFLNTTGAQVNVVYTVVPVSAGPASCTGTAFTVTVPVNPEPVVAAQPLAAICSKTAVGVNFNASTSVAAATYNITVLSLNGATVFAGGPAVGTGLLATALADDAFQNVTGATVNVVYTVVPVSAAAASCQGVAFTVTVPVTPEPVIGAPFTKTICSGDAVNYTIALTPAGLPATTVFNWPAPTMSDATVQGTIGTNQPVGTTISDVLINLTAAPTTATYNITPSNGACGGTMQPVVITINPVPAVENVIGSASVCVSLNPVVYSVTNFNSLDLTTSYSWSIPAGFNRLSGGGGAVPGGGFGPFTAGDGILVLNFPIVATGSLQVIKRNSFGCTTTAIPLTVTSVAAPPILPIDVDPAPYCYNQTGVKFFIGAPNPASTYSWSIAAGAGTISGSSVGPIISVNLGVGPFVTVTVTETNTIGCATTFLPETILINPVPDVLATPAAQTLCSGTNTNIVLSTPNGTPGTTYTWTVAQSGVTGGANQAVGVAGPINQTLSTLGAAVGTATYTITPTAGGCSGTPVNVVVTVNPLPTVAANPVAPTQCSGVATNIVLSNPNAVAGTAYYWTVVQAGVVGAANGGTFATPVAGPIAQVLTTTAAAQGTATYTIRPVANGCEGPSTIVVVTVDPIPNVAFTPASETLCSGQTTGIALSTPNGVPGAAYFWTVVQAGVVGATNSGTVAAPVAGPISQSLLTTGASPGTATYTVTPVAAGCTGTPQVVVITVNPIPNVAATPPSATICSGAATNIALSTPNLVAGTLYTWTVVQSNVAGAANQAVPTAGPIAQTLTATATTPGSATYTVTPIANACPGTPIDVIITVNPVPNVLATPAAQTLCSGQSTGIALSNPNAVLGTQYFWTVVQAGVAGASNQGSLISPVNGPISQTLTTTGSVPGTATYTVTPVANGCPGTSTNVIVTVNPLPNVVATPAAQTICSGGTTGIALSTTNGVAGTQYFWTVTQSGVAGGFNQGTLGAPIAGPIAQLLTTTISATGTATYVITPVANGCAGTSTSVVVTVNPVPVGVPTIMTVCSDVAVGISLNSLVVGGALAASSYDITSISNASGLIASAGAPATGTGFSAAEIADDRWTNTQGIQRDIIYTIVPISGTVPPCSGTPFTLTVHVDPEPVVAAVANQSFCPTDAINIALSSNVGGATINWTNTNTAIGLAASGTGDIIYAAPANNTGANLVGTITVSATNSGCTSAGANVKTFTITIKPTPVMVANSNVVVCSGANVAAITFSANTGGGETFTWTNSNPAIGLGAGGVGNIASFTAGVNITGVPIVATIGVSATRNVCVGPVSNFTITVNPEPVVAAVANQSFCPGDAVNIPLTSNVAGAAISWTNSNTSIGAGATGAGDVIYIAPANNSGVNIVGTITVSGTANGCVSTGGNQKSFTITIKPSPIMTANANITVCSGTAVPLITFSANTGGGETFDWTNDNVAIGLAASGSGNIASYLAPVNTTGASIVGNMSVTGTLNLCTGPARNFTITILPQPVGIPTTITVCSDAAVGVNLSTLISGALGASTYNITTITNLSGLVASAGAPVTGNGFSATVVQDDRWTNTTGIQRDIIYTIVPVSGSVPSCAGAPFDLTVHVDPEPVVAAVANQSFCPTDPINIPLTSNAAGATINWTNTNPAIGLAASGSGSIVFAAPANNTGGDLVGTITVSATLNGCTSAGANAKTFTITIKPSPIMAANANVAVCSGANVAAISFSANTGGGEVFNWTNTNVAIGLAAAGVGNIASFTAGINTTGVPIVATIGVSGTKNGCTGPVSNFTITVNPEPVVTAVANQSFCPGEAVNIPLTSNVAGAVISWTNSNTSIGLGATGGGDVIYIAPANNTGVNIVGTITVVGTANGCVSAGANIETFTITIKPSPIMNANANITVCSGTAVPLVTFSANTGGGETFDWTNDNVAIGLAASGAGNIASYLAPVNTTGASIVGNISVTGTLNLCTGPAKTFTITILPQPVGVPTTITVCSDATVGVNLSTLISGALGASTYNITAITNVSGLVASAGAPVVGNGFGATEVQNDKWTNATGVQHDIIYTIVPVSGANCPGAPFDLTVHVDPEPVVAAVANQTFCPTDAVNIPLSSNVAGATLNWTNTNPTIGLAASGSGNIVYAAPANNTGADLVGTITVSATLNGCTSAGANVKTFTITIKPTPVMSATSNIAVCSGANVPAITFSANTGGGEVFNWTNSNIAIGLAGAGVGNIATFAAAVNTTGAPIVATIGVSATKNGCIGPVSNFTITINPEPVVTAVADVSACALTSIAAINFTTNAGGGETFSWTNSNTAIGLAASGFGSIGSYLAPNNVSGVDIVGTITVTATLTGCVSAGANVETFTITIKSLPVGGNDITPIVDSDGVLSYDLQNNVNTLGNTMVSTFSWVAANNVNVSGESLVPVASGFINDVLHNVTNTNQSVLYTVTPTSNGCAGAPFFITITVRPEPVGINDVVTVNSDVNINYNLQNNVNSIGNGLPSTFTWVTTDNPQLTGESLALQTTGTITDIVTNVSGVDQVLIYTVTPTGVNGVPGDPFTVTVTIRSEPVGSDDVASVCSKGTPNYDLQNNLNTPPGNSQLATFSWFAASNVNVSGESIVPQAGAFITDALRNFTGGDELVTYTVTPTGTNGCPGNTFQIVVTVRPEPVVATTLDETKCSGDVYGKLLNTNGVSIGAATYDVTVTSIGAGLTGGRPLGLIGGGGSADNVLMADTWINNTSVPLNAVYSVVPNGTNGCVGDARLVTFTINPAPALSSPGFPAVCSTNLSVNNIVNVVFGTNGVSVAAASYELMNIQYSTGGPFSPVLPPGFTAVGGNAIIGAVGSNDLVRNDRFTNGLNIPVTVRYTVRGTSGAGCVSANLDYDVAINPEPVLDPLLNPTPVCSGVISGVTMGVAAGSVGAASYNINSLLFPGLTAGGSNTGIGNNKPANAIFNDVYVNTTNGVLTAIYKISPVSAAGCIGPEGTITLTIQPSPDLSNSLNRTVCINTNGGVVFSTTGSSVPAANYNLISVTLQPLLVAAGGNVAPANGVATNYVSADQFNNPTNGPLTVTYRVAPVSAAPCTGPAEDIILTIEPTITATPLSLKPTVCSGSGNGTDLTDIEMISPTNPSAGVITFNYTAVSSIGTGITGFVPALSGLAEGFKITDNLVNTSDLPATVTYSITPVASGAASGAGCMGLAATIIVTVEPKPKLAIPAFKTICEGVPTAISLTSTTTPSAGTIEFLMVTAVPSSVNITGASANGTVFANGSTLNDVLSNNSTFAETMTYTFRPRYLGGAGCVGDDVITTVSVNPRPTVVPSPQPQICSGDIVDITLTTDVASTVPIWTVTVDPGVTGASAGAGDRIFQILFNNAAGTTGPLNVTYNVTPTAAGCAGTVVNIPVIVNPLARVTGVPTTVTVCHNAALNVPLTSNVTAGVSFAWTVVDSSGGLVGGAVAGSGNVINQVLTNTSGAQATLTYTITPTGPGPGAGCVGQDKIMIVTVSPEITANWLNTPSPDFICFGSTEFLVLNIGGRAPFNFQYNDGTTNFPRTNQPPVVVMQHVPLVGATTYTLTTVTDGLGCTVPFNVPFVVNVGDTDPNFTIVSPTPIAQCSPNEVTFQYQQVAGTIYTWRFGESADSVYTATTTVPNMQIKHTYINLSPSSTLNYPVTMQTELPPPFPGCFKTTPAKTVTIFPNVIVNVIANNTQICSGDLVTFMNSSVGTNAQTWSFSTGGGPETVMGSTFNMNFAFTNTTAANPLVYDIHFRATNGLCPAELDPPLQISVYRKSQADFDEGVVLPFISGSSLVDFTNTSSIIDADFSFTWVFGPDAVPPGSNLADPLDVSYVSPGPKDVTLTVTNVARAECTTMRTKQINIILPPLVAMFDINPKFSCFPSTVSVSTDPLVTQITGDIIEWKVVDQNNRTVATSSGVFPEFAIPAPGEYTVFLTTKSSQTGQTATATPVDITVYGQPFASFDARPDVLFVPDTELTVFNFSEDPQDLQFTWDFGDGDVLVGPAPPNDVPVPTGTHSGRTGGTFEEPTHFYKIEGLYDLTMYASFDHGNGVVCIDTLKQQVQARQGGVTKVPNAFTPSPNGPSGGQGGNGSFNDVFLPIVKGADEFNLQIYDRWGNMIFESNSSQIGWDGYSADGKLLPSGVYVYKLTVRLSDGQRSTQIGDITMIR